MTKALLGLVPVLLFTGCQAAQMKDAMNEGLALEKEARTTHRRDQHPKAIPLWAQSAAKLEESLKIAEERQTIVFVSFLTAKLSIVSAGEAVCSRPDENEAGTWDRAFELYGLSAAYAQDAGLLKLKRNARFGQAECVRPDHNAEKGSWEKALKLYEEGYELAKEYEDDEDMGEALRLQAFCMLEGNLEGGLTEKAQRLLEKARRLGDEEAAELLRSTETTYCIACGASLARGADFCKECGRDQSKPMRKKKEPPKVLIDRMRDGKGSRPGQGPNNSPD